MESSVRKKRSCVFYRRERRERKGRQRWGQGKGGGREAEEKETETKMEYFIRRKAKWEVPVSQSPPLFSIH